MYPCYSVQAKTSNYERAHFGGLVGVMDGLCLSCIILFPCLMWLTVAVTPHLPLLVLLKKELS